MHVLLIEPYFGGSHRAWAEGYRDHSGHDVTLLTLPARWWRWRMRGGAVTIAERAAELAEAGYRPDVVLVSSMIDLGLLRSLLPAVWGRVPAALYLHESQLTYPDSPQLEPDVSYGFLNWTSALAADRVIFNSEYHRDVFFEQVWRLLRGFPDFTHEHLVERVRSNSTVLPVGIDLSWVRNRPERDGPPLVLWNHRWEHDKAPEEFFDAVRTLAAEGLAFRLAVCGESFRQVPEEFLQAACDLGDRMEHFGFAVKAKYREILLRADVVVSTARQEFFGVAVMEAIAAGAFPVLPSRLVYPSLIPAGFREAVLYPEGTLVDRLRSLLERPTFAFSFQELEAFAQTFDWRRIAPRYDVELVDIRAN